MDRGVDITTPKRYDGPIATAGTKAYIQNKINIANKRFLEKVNWEFKHIDFVRM